MEISSKDLTLQKHALAEIPKIDVFKDLAKFKMKQLYRSLY